MLRTTHYALLTSRVTDTALVTGGAGFLGSHVVDALVARGLDVVVLDDLSGGFPDNVNPSARLVRGSILDVELVDSLFNENRIRRVYHLAAYAAEGLSHFIRRFNYQNNLIGSVNLIDASVNHDVESFVFTSSIAVYGVNQLPMREELVPSPEDPYGIAKLAVEQDLRASRQLFGLNYVIFRPHNVYGERQNIGDRYRNVIGIFMSQILRGEPLTIFGDGSQTRAFTYVGDIAPVIAQARSRRPLMARYSMSGQTRPVTSVDWLAWLARRWAWSLRSATCRRATKCCTPTPLTTRYGASSTARSKRRWKKGCGGWPPGRARWVRARAHLSTTSRSVATFPRSGWTSRVGSRRFSAQAR